MLCMLDPPNLEKLGATLVLSVGRRAQPKAVVKSLADGKSSGPIVRNGNGDAMRNSFHVHR